MSSIIEREAGVRAGQWVKTEDGRVGLVREATDLNGFKIGSPCIPGAKIMFPTNDEAGFEWATLPSTAFEITDPAPWEGMEATRFVGSDRYPAEVVMVHPSGKKIMIRELRALGVNPQGAYDDREGEYAYASNPDAPVETYSWRKNGRWVREGEPMNDGAGIGLGFASTYRDPHV